MSLAVSNQAQNLYSQYTLQNSDTYKKNAVDASAVSKQDYGVSNLTDALDAMENTDRVNLDSVGNIDQFVSNLYTISQLQNYNTLADDTKNAAAAELLPGNKTDNGLSNIYNLLAPDKDANEKFLEGVIQKAESNASSASGTARGSDTAINTGTSADINAGSQMDSYNQFLSGTQSGSLLDTSI